MLDTAEEVEGDGRGVTARAQGAQGEVGDGFRVGKFKETAAGVNAVAKRVVEAAIEVHRHLGPGYLEAVYQEALEVELGLRGVSFERQAVFRVMYKQREVGAGRLDLLVERCVVVELKAVDQLHELHVAQALAYLKGTGLTLALVINFKVPVLLRGVRRVAANPPLAQGGALADAIAPPGPGA
jgi:GxxExxY protein